MDYLIERHLFQSIMDLVDYLLNLYVNFLRHLDSINNLHYLLMTDLNDIYLFDIDYIISRHLKNCLFLHRYFNNTFMHHQLLYLINDRTWSINNQLLYLHHLNDFFKDYWPFHDQGNYFWYIEWHLNLNAFNFGIIDVYFLIFYAISICWHCNFTNHLIGNSLLDNHFNYLFSLDYSFNDLLHLHYLNLLHVFYHSILYLHLDDLLDCLNLNEWDLYLHNLKYWHFNKYNLLYNLRNLHYLLYYPRHNHYLLDYLFYLNHSRHLDYLLHYLFYDLFLDSYYLLFNDHWNMLLYYHLLYLLFCYWYYLAFLDLEFSYCFGVTWDVYFCEDGDLFCDVARDYLLYF